MIINKYVMKKMIVCCMLTMFVSLQAQDTIQEEISVEYNKLTEFESFVILDKGTERPWTGEYVDHKETGVYVCKRCNAPLYRSGSKFDSHCGWPSLDDEIEGGLRIIVK